MRYLPSDTRCYSKTDRWAGRHDDLGDFGRQHRISAIAEAHDATIGRAGARSDARAAVAYDRRTRALGRHLRAGQVRQHANVSHPLQLGVELRVGRVRTGSRAAGGVVINGTVTVIVTAWRLAGRLELRPLCIVGVVAVEAKRIEDGKFSC